MGKIKLGIGQNLASRRRVLYNAFRIVLVYSAEKSEKHEEMKTLRDYDGQTLQYESVKMLRNLDIESKTNIRRTKSQGNIK